MARTIPFAKANGLGNDFVLVRAADVAGLDPGELARRICDRFAGVGADGLVTLGPSDSSDAAFRIYNSDGSEAGLSGNALRCAAAWLLDREGNRERIRMETRVGPRDQFVVKKEPGAWILRAEIGEPVFGAAQVPFRPPRRPAEPIVAFPLPVADVIVPVTVLNMGNPQCIVLREEGEAYDWCTLGAEMERHPFFPDRTNVGFVEVLSAQTIRARFWERGAGHTLASGTGSCACAVAAHLNGRTGRRVTVEVERGKMEVGWREDGIVDLTGPAEVTVEGSFRLDAGKESRSAKGEAAQ